MTLPQATRFADSHHSPPSLYLDVLTRPLTATKEGFRIQDPGIVPRGIGILDLECIGSRTPQSARTPRRPLPRSSRTWSLAATQSAFQSRNRLDLRVGSSNLAVEDTQMDVPRRGPPEIDSATDKPGPHKKRIRSDPETLTVPCVVSPKPTQSHLRDAGIPSCKIQ
jgi:hypothetical protein